MITTENLKALLHKLNFEKSGNIYVKNFPSIDAYLKVDFAKKELIYPTEKGFTVNGEFTCNFSSPENFVVFECVNRLFERGYKPQHIELEQAFGKIKKEDGGGRADIVIKDNQNKVLLIIECKTAVEFNRHWDKTKADGDQLFRYLVNKRETQFLCLYTADFVDEKAITLYHVISLNDNDRLLKELENKKPLSFTEAKKLNKENIYKAWKETYKLDFATKGVFEEDILPYEIGKTKYTITDLVEISSKDIQSKYNEFATILRQYNVSGRENAFDKLVNLFLCKIVDEFENPNDLKFYWKGIAIDNYFDLIDRLQTLYQYGMDKFLEERVTNVNKAEIEDAFRFVKKDPDATKDTILKFFRELKYFKNNDFSFIDVHNENLFYKNSVILLEIVKMLQDIKLKSDDNEEKNKQHQFLGDLFEGFLDQGVKQSEGQFFTPMPIVKFMISSLPLETIIKESDSPPKAIDYACGAGHFLNELALQIKPFVAQHKATDVAEYYKQIVGIEKEYRLSKVAKVSAFMYGQDDIKIMYADALGNNAKLQNNDYSILVANPPYSVKGFLQTLNDEERKAFELIKTIEEKSLANNNSIETFFIEKAKQLLKPNAIAAIILPASILSNDNNIYTATREILIKYFTIVSIVKFGSQTFGKTGTNTVALFLKRKEENPAPADHWKNRIDDWFTDDEANFVYDDNNYINRYCNHINVDIEDYKTLLNGNPNETLLATEMFMEYKKAFDKKKQNINSRLNTQEKANELHKRFIEYLQAIEKDKVYYYVLAAENKIQNNDSKKSIKVLVVEYGSKTKEQKQFLGYSWSSAKGKEGIKYLNDNVSAEDNEINEDISVTFDDKEDQRILNNLNSISNIQTPLYNPKKREDSSKVNYYIEQNFLGNELQIDESLKNFISYYSLEEMLDFSRKDFNKEISLTPKRVTTIESKWELVKLGDVVNIKIGGTPSRENAAYFKGTNLWVSIAEMKGQIINDTKEQISDEGIKKSNVKLIPKGTTLLSFKLSIGKTAIAGKDLYTNEAIAGLIPIDKNKVLDSYLYQIFTAKQIDLEGTGFKAFGKSLNSDFLNNDVKIPLPPKEIQTKIVEDCQTVDKEIEILANEIEKTQREIKNIVDEINNQKYPEKSLSDVAKELFAGGDASKNNFSPTITEKFSVPIYANGVKDKGLYGYTDIPKVKDTCITISARGTLGYTEIRTEPFVPIVRLIVLIPNSLVDVNYLKVVVSNLNFTDSGSVIPQLTVPKVRGLKIPVPPIAEQQKLVATIEQLEQKITVAQTVIDNATYKKKEIMKKYL